MPPAAASIRLHSCASYPAPLMKAAGGTAEHQQVRPGVGEEPGGVLHLGPQGHQSGPVHLLKEEGAGSGWRPPSGGICGIHTRARRRLPG